TPQTFTPKSAARRIRAMLAFSGFASGAAGVTQVRLLVNGKALGSVYPVFWNTLTQHQSWMFQWPLAVGSLGVPGSIATVKAQVISPTGSTAQFNMDQNDSSSLVAEELG